jgi:hypothetical protein
MASLQRLAVQRSPAYKPAGVKSYVYAMTKCTLSKFLRFQLPLDF